LSEFLGLLIENVTLVGVCWH